MIVDPKFSCCEKCNWGLARTKVLPVFRNEQVLPIKEVAVYMIDDAGGSVIRKVPGRRSDSLTGLRFPSKLIDSSSKRLVFHSAVMLASVIPIAFRPLLPDNLLRRICRAPDSHRR